MPRKSLAHGSSGHGGSRRPGEDVPAREDFVNMQYEAMLAEAKQKTRRMTRRALAAAATASGAERRSGIGSEAGSEYSYAPPDWTHTTSEPEKTPELPGSRSHPSLRTSPISKRFQTTARTGQDEIVQATAAERSSDSYETVEEQRVRNKARRKKLSGTYWSLGDQAVDYQTASQRDATRCSKARAAVAGTELTPEEQVRVNRERRRKLAGTQWSYGRERNTYERAPGADSVFKEGMPRPGGDDLFERKQFFKYDSTGLAGAITWGNEGGGTSLYDTDERRRQREVGAASKLRTAEDIVEERRVNAAKKKAAQLTTAFDAAAPNAPVWNKRNDCDNHALAFNPGDFRKRSHDAKERRKIFRAAQWKLGSQKLDYSTDNNDAFAGHNITSGSVQRIAAERKRAKELKAALQRPTLVLGDDLAYM